MSTSDSGLVHNRREKLASWSEEVGDPYQARFVPDSSIPDILLQFSHLGTGESSRQSVKTAGRVAAQRSHGKAVFLDLIAGGEKIQLYVRANNPRFFSSAAKLDIGDVIGVEGEVFRTRSGELTIQIVEFTLLAKSLHPLPEKWHGLQDVELRHRKRWLDLIVNPRARQVALKRAAIIRALRSAFHQRGFVEVETPILQSAPGGATARPFQTYHNALGEELFLRIAPELYLKKLVVGGMEKVFELSRNFRNEGIDRFHNPEFTMVEAYQAYADYEDIMLLVEELVAEVAREVTGETSVTYGEAVIDLSPPWRRIRFYEALRDIGGITDDVRDDTVLTRVGREQGIDVDSLRRSQVLEHLIDKVVIPHLVQPTILYDYPIETAPLARQKKDDPTIAERFEVFIAASELANAYSELNNPIEQRERLSRVSDESLIDWDFLESLEHGMPPTGGLGIGVDRLVMLLTNAQSIREVILFPQLKSKQTTTKQEEC